MFGLIRKEKRSWWSTTLVALALFSTMMLATQSRAGATDNESYTVHFIGHEFVPAAGLDERLGRTVNTERWHGLIQFSSQHSEATKLELAAIGIELLQYVPDNTWLASFPADYRAALNISSIRSITEYAAEYKLDAVLQSEALRSSFIINGSQLPIVVTLFDDVNITDASTKLTSFARGSVFAEPAAHLVRMQINVADLLAVAALDSVLSISVDLGSPMATLDGVRAPANVDAVHAAPYNRDGTNINVVILDEGIVDGAHPDLSGRVTTPEGGTLSVHGTHVGGIVASNGLYSDDMGFDPLQFKGFAPNANLISYSWSNPIGRHDIAINSYDAEISQNSWGFNNCTYFGMYILYAGDFDGIITGDFGARIPVIFAAGNTGGWCGNSYGTVLGGPSSSKNVLTVGATTKAGDVVSYSAYGPTRDGRLKPELVAVGHNVISTCTGQYTYCYSDGTSMAAPAVSGTAALLLEEYRDSCTAMTGPSGLLDPLPSTYRAWLIHSASDLNDAADQTTLGPDFVSGYGALDSQAAVDLVPDFIEGNISDGQQIEYTVTITDEAQLRATLVWDDPEAAHNASVTLINDLDIELISPDGNFVYGPWILDPTSGNEGNAATRPNWATGGTATRDQINVVEQVVVDAPIAGDWTIRILGSDVPNGPQSFSLVNEELETNSCNSFASTLSGTQSGGDVQLSWSDIDSFTSFEIYRSSSAAFVPGDGNTTLIATIDSTGYSDGQTINYADSGIINGSVATYYYAVRGVSSSGATSAISNLVAKVDFTLTEGQLNNLSWNLDTTINDSDALQSQIEANSSTAVSVEFIESYDEASQSFRLFSRSPFTFGLFNITDSNSYRVAVNVDSGSSTVWTLVGAYADSLDLLTPEMAAAPAMYYGQLNGATPGAAQSYVAWTGTAPGAPGEIITEDSFNVGDGSDQGYQNDYWLVNYNNLTVPPADGATVNILLGGTTSSSSPLWSYSFMHSTASESANQGVIASTGSAGCPDLSSIARVGSDNYVNFQAPAGTYLVYRSQQAGDSGSSRSNGRYQFVAALTTGTSSGSYIDSTSVQSWYIIVPADGSNNITGCHSPERGTSTPTAIQLDSFTSEPGTTSPILFIGLLGAAILTIGLVTLPIINKRFTG